MAEQKILYRGSSETEVTAYLSRWVLPVDDKAKIKQDDTSKGESWIVLGNKKMTRKPVVVTPK